MTKKKTTTFDIPNNTPAFTENLTTSKGNKSEEKGLAIEPAKTNNTMTQRTIETATAANIVNNRTTTLVALQSKSPKGCTNLNILKAHKNIFSAMNLINQH